MSLFSNANRSYFEGWYLKHQNRHGQTLALIPAFHIDSAGQRTASLQVISNAGAWWLEYPEAQLQFSRQPFQVQFGQSGFSHQGSGWILTMGYSMKGLSSASVMLKSVTLST